jgi:hypothetical protein
MTLGTLITRESYGAPARGRLVMPRLFLPGLNRHRNDHPNRQHNWCEPGRHDSGLGPELFATHENPKLNAYRSTNSAKGSNARTEVVAGNATHHDLERASQEASITLFSAGVSGPSLLTSTSTGLPVRGPGASSKPVQDGW